MPAANLPLWALVLAGTVLTPLVTWLPMLVLQHPSLAMGVWPGLRIGAGWVPPLIFAGVFVGAAVLVARWHRVLGAVLGLYAVSVLWSGPLPLVELAPGADYWQLNLVIVSGAVLVAFWVGARDRWLGALILLAAVGQLLHGIRLEFSQLVFLALGALMLIAVRQTPRAWFPRVALILAISGLFQAAYMIQQAVFRYDVFWGPIFGGTFLAHMEPVGTLGTVDAASAYVAITAAVMPWWGLPLAAWAILVGRSYGALVAFTAVLVLRAWGPSWRRRSLAVALALGSGVAGWGVVHLKGLGTVMGRLDIWAFAAQDWWRTDPLTGVGLSGWLMRIPRLQAEARFFPNGEGWAQAHSEWFQVLYELGAAGLLVVLAWCWAHRRSFLDRPWGAAAVALGIVSATFFPFHVGSTALLSVVTLGLATAETPVGG